MRFFALLRKLAAAFALACLFVGATVLGFALHLDLPRGRRVVSNLVGKALASELRGSFSVGAFERLRPNGATVRDFVVNDERGREVLRVSRVTVRAQLLPMLRDVLVAPKRAHLVFDEVELAQADARLYDDEGNGVPSLALSFAPRPRAKPSRPSSPSALRVSIRSFSLSRGYARGQLGGLPTLELEVSQLRGATEITETSVDLELGRFGVVARGIGGADARGVGSLRLHEPGSVWTSFDGYFGDVQVGSVLRVERDQVFCTLTLPRASPAAMRGLLPGYPLQKDAVVHADAQGRLPELSLNARVEVEETRAVGSGALRLDAPVKLDLDVIAEALDASALVEGLPHTRLDANAHVAVRILGEPTVTVRAVSQPGEVDRIPVPAAEVDASYDGKLLRGTALLREPGLPVRARFELLPGGVFDLHAESRDVDLRRAPRLRGIPGDGVIALRVDAHVENGKLRASASGDIRDYRNGDFALARAVVDARATGELRHWRSLNVSADVKSEGINAGGLNFASADAHAQGSLENPRVKLELEDVRGGKLELSAQLKALERETEVQNLELGYRREQAELRGRLRRLRVGDGELELSDLELTGLGGKLAGSLEWTPQRMSVDARGTALRLGELARLLGLPTYYVAGTLDFDTEVVLARDIERGKLNLKLTEGSLGPLPDVTATFNAALEDGRLQGDATTEVRNVANGNARFDVQIPGSARDLASLKDAIGEVSLSVSEINLGLLSQVLAPGKTPPVQGRLAVAWRASRRVPYALPSIDAAAVTTGLVIQAGLLDPKLPTLEGVDAQFGVNVNGESGASDASLKLIDARGTLASASVSTTLDLAALLSDPRGTVARLPDAPLLGKLLVDERQLSEFPRGLIPPFGDGRVRIEASLSGSLNAPVLAGRLRLGAFELARPASSRPLDICASIAWDRATERLGANGELFLSNANARTCEGQRVGLYTLLAGLSPNAGRPRLEGSAVLSLERLPVDAIPGLGEAGLAGRVTGKASFTQNGPVPAFSANLTLREARVRDIPVGDGKLELRSNEQALGVTLDLKQSQGSLQATALAALDYSGLFPSFKPGEAIGLRIVAQRADAVMLSPFVKDVMTDLSGTLDADVSARISRNDKPAEADADRVQGTLAMHDGAFELLGLGLKLQDVEFSAQADAAGNETRISVPLLTGHSSKGRRAVAVRDARVWLQGFTVARAEGRIDASELPLTLPGIPQATATTRQSIAFKVRRTPREMQADVDVPYLVVALPQAAARDLISLDENRSIEILQPIGQPGQGSGDGLPWRFAFDLGQNVKLTRPDLELPLTGHAEVLLADKVEVTGDVDLIAGGRIDVSGKTFVVEAGEVHFDTGDAGNPRIRVTATYRPPDGSLITAEVSGTLKQATLNLSSPTKDLQQIYAVLLGGSGGPEGGGGDARAAGAGVGADQLLGPLLANTPLRKVEIRTGSELTADRRSYSTYSAAVPISDQVWFEGSYKTLNSPDRREQGSAVSGTVDFRFRRNWSLRTEIGTIGTGVDLLWNYRY